MRVAVIGLGKMGLLHASILNSMPNIEVSALCEKSFLIRRIFRKIFKEARLVGDVEKLSSSEIDAVYVTTPIPSHYFIIKDVYLRGLTNNVFVEKTLGANLPQSKELCEIARNCGGINMVGYMKRFSVTFKKTKALLDQSVLGHLKSFETYAYSSDFASENTLSRSASRGGVLCDLGSHIVDLALWFFGDLDVESAVMESTNGSGSEDTADFKVRSLDGLEGHFEVSWCKRGYRLPEFGLTIRGSNGTVRADGDKVELDLEDEKTRWFKQDLDDKVRFLLGDPEYCREDEYFTNSISTNIRPEPSFDSATKVDHVIDQVRRRATADG